MTDVYVAFFIGMGLFVLYVLLVSRHKLPEPKCARTSKHCPMCGGVHIKYREHGFDKNKALFWSGIARGGWATGYIKSDWTDCKCQDCGFEWTVNERYRDRNW